MGQLAVQLGVSPQLVSSWKSGVRHPTPPQRETIEHASAVPPAAWLYWVLGDGIEQDIALPPASEDRLVSVEPAKLGSTRDEILDCAARCKALARSPGLSAREQAAIEVQRKGALSELRRMDENAAIEVHPDFESFLDDIIGATCDALSARGHTDPAIKSEIAQALRRRGDLRERRAA
jgi:transcriptional regulator with XRE-family HTH domain